MTTGKAPRSSTANLLRNRLSSRIEDKKPHILAYLDRAESKWLLRHMLSAKKLSNSWKGIVGQIFTIKIFMFFASDFKLRPVPQPVLVRSIIVPYNGGNETKEMISLEAFINIQLNKSISCWLYQHTYAQSQTLTACTASQLR